MGITEKLDNIIKKYKEHPNWDPDLPEYLGICREIGEYQLDFDYKSKLGILKLVIENLKLIKTNARFKELSEIVSNRMLTSDLGITKESQIYQLFLNSKRATENIDYYEDTDLRQEIAKIKMQYLKNERLVKDGYKDIPPFATLEDYTNLIIKYRTTDDPDKDGFPRLNYSSCPPVTTRDLLIIEIKEHFGIKLTDIEKQDYAKTRKIRL